MPSGPVPKHPSARARRNATFAMTQLPAEGRQGKPPSWPLPADPRRSLVGYWEEQAALLEAQAAEEDDGRRRNRMIDRAARARARAVQVGEEVAEASRLERRIWRDAWRTPMAVQWERSQWTREVAQYCRLKAAGELGDTKAAKTALAYADRLGLNPWSLLRLRWEVAPAPAQEPPRATVTRIRDVCDDFA